MGDIKTVCSVNKYTFARCDGLINQLLLRKLLTLYLVLNAQCNLHKILFAYHVYGVLKKGTTLFHVVVIVVEKFDVMLVGLCHVMLGRLFGQHLL